MFDQRIQTSIKSVFCYDRDVLMPNHYHLQIETPRLNLSEAIKWLNVSYVSWFNRKARRNGPLLQGRFKAVIHDPDEAGWTIHEYIHLNPVRVKRFAATAPTTSDQPGSRWSRW